LPAASPLALAPDSEQAGVDAATKLMGNFDRVVQDICNPGPENIDGKTLSQGGLKRVNPSDTESVQKMVSAVCGRLLGKGTPGPSSPEEAGVWMTAAKFLASRIQAPGDCPGRKPDMSAAQAEALRAVLAQTEAASKLINNCEVVVQDITNPGPRGVKGGQLSQAGLKRVDRKDSASVDAMIRELSSRLLGNSVKTPANDEVAVWLEAAAFFGKRVQAPSDECPGRKADMSNAAARALRTAVGQMEAAYKLISNSERVVQDLVNAGPKNIEGKTLTQTGLQRVDGKHKAVVEEMVKALGSRLLGHGVAGPVSPEEGQVWLEAATFLSDRIQASKSEMPGRDADMSSNGAKAFRGVLAEFEAVGKLVSNRETVVKDITNPGMVGVNGGSLTQRSLKRVAFIHYASVDAMIGELSNRILGRKVYAPSTSGEAGVWAEAAVCFNGRIQASADAFPGRAADMSPAAAAAMRKALASIANKSDKIDAASREASQKLMSNHVRVVEDITNPGPKNIDGKRLTQTDLKRVDIEHQMLVGAMVREVCCCLVGKPTLRPLAPEQVQVWAAAATFLSARTQGQPAEMPGRAPDMSPEAANALRAKLAQVEAAYMLMSNRDRVVQDITNAGSSNIDGKKLTQTELRRVDNKHEVSVNAMIKEVSCRLLGKAPMSPSPQEAAVWAEAAKYLGSRIQATAAEMPGRKPDMSPDAATALRTVLGQF